MKSQWRQGRGWGGEEYSRQKDCDMLEEKVNQGELGGGGGIGSR